MMKLVERWEVLDKESGTSLTPPERFRFGLGDVILQEESPLKRRKLQRRDDRDCDHHTPASKMRSGQRSSPWRRRQVSGAPPRARSSSSPWKHSEQHSVPVPTAVHSAYQPGNLSSSARWPLTRTKLDSTPSLPLSGRHRSGSQRAELPVISTHCEEHPPHTVMPGQAGHLRHLRHQDHQGSHHHPFDDLVPSTERSPSSSSPSSSLRRKARIKPLNNIDIDVAENDRKKEEDDQSQVMKQEEEANERKKLFGSFGRFGRKEEKKDIHTNTNLREPRSETSQCSSLISVGYCGPRASSSSSGGSRAPLTTRGGRGRAEGALGGFSFGDNIETLHRGGENCRADAAYICTQFWGPNSAREGTEDEGPVHAGQWERARVTNPDGALGLANGNQRADAIPRGDCNNQQQHSSARNPPDELEKV